MAARERPWLSPRRTATFSPTLDERVPTAFYWQLTLLATLGGFLFGYDTSNIGSALNFVPYHLQGPGPGLPGLRGLAGRGRRSDPGRAGRGPVRPQAAADHRRRHLRGRLDPVRRHLACLGPAHRAHADRGGHRRGLGHRHRLHRRVRAEGPARVADHAPAVDDHGRHPGRLHRGADHLRPLAGQRGLVWLAAGARPGRRAGPDRAGDALPHAGVTAVAAAARQVRRGAQGHGHARRAGRQRGRCPARRGGGGTGRGRQPRVAAPGLDARGAAGAGRGQRVLHLPADHRDQRAVVLRAAPARAVLLRRARLAGRHHGGRRGGHLDHDGGQRGRHLPGFPLDRQVRPETARHRRLHRDDRLRAGHGAGPGRSCPARCGWSSS